MAQTERKWRDEVDALAERGAPVPAPITIATGDEPPTSSPALDLQRELDGLWRDRGPDASRRWAPRATLMLGGAISLSVWAAIAATAWALLH